MNIIRIEVQVTPRTDMESNDTYYWKVYQLNNGARITLTDGFERSLYKATAEAYLASEQYK